jgi:hypothetical protein
MSTIRVTNAKTLEEKSETIGIFSQFFLGELADSYLNPVSGGGPTPALDA